MLLGARTAAWSGKALPYDEELEYIESNGNQYIETGVRCEPGVSMKGTFIARSVNSQSFIGGWYPNGCRCCLIVYSNTTFGINFGNQTAYGSYDVIFNLNQQYYVDVFLGNSRIYLKANGATAFDRNVSESFTNEETIKLGRANWTGGYVNVRGCFFRMNFGGSISRNLVPVLKDGIPCMYDELNDEFLYNQVSGHKFGYKKKDGTIVSPT